MNRIIGICPQKDALIMNMTVMENLYYFLGMRLMTVKEIEDYAESMLEKLNILKKKDEFVLGLSGGQKRKLQLAIALAGDTRLIMLDEPSSGMDPTARKETWDLIKDQAKGRIIIMTTHYMDEADALGDRIGIMSKGKLKTCGSSLFLKNSNNIGVLIEIGMYDKEKGVVEVEDIINSYMQ